MLVLRRRNQESIVLLDAHTGHQIGEIVVVGIDGGTVRLGFRAGPEVNVVRRELLEDGRPGLKKHGGTVT